MDRFVHSQNLLHYIDLLERETDPAKRERIHRLLLEEENKAARRRERAIEVDVLIAAVRAKVQRQQQIVTVLDGAMPEAAPARALLATMEETLAMLTGDRDDLD